MTITDSLAEIKARADAATPGQWAHNSDGYITSGESGMVVDYAPYAADRALIASSRTDIPRLVRALEVAESAICREEDSATAAGRSSQAQRLRGTLKEIEAALRGEGKS